MTPWMHNKASSHKRRLSEPIIPLYWKNVSFYNITICFARSEQATTVLR